MVFTGYDQRGGGVKNKKSKGGASKEGGEEKEEAGPTMVAGSLGGGDTATLHLEAQIAKLQGKIEAGFNTGSNHDYLDEQDAQRDLKQCQERLAAMSVVGMGDKVDKWRVENSWGEKDSRKGYLVMSDDWFTDHMYVEEKEAREGAKRRSLPCGYMLYCVVCGVQWRWCVLCTAVCTVVYCALCCR